MRPRLPQALAAGAAAAVLALTVASCASGGGSDESADSAGASDAASVPSQVQAPASSADEAFADAPVAADSDSTVSTGNTGNTDNTGRTGPDTTSPTVGAALIRTGTVNLRSADVAKARFQVQQVVDRHDGEVAEENTEADQSGEAERARLVLRVPVDDFDPAITELREVADLIRTDTHTDDVTTKVIDTDVRVRLQRRSIERISLLLDRAQSIRDIVSIERELSQREAELGSLEKRQSYLSDQTALATITVSIERPAKKKADAKPEKRDEAGFLPGLRDGWHALTGLTVGGLQVGGALLPFAAVLLLLGGPLWLVRRRIRPAPPGTQSS